MDSLKIGCRRAGIGAFLFVSILLLHGGRAGLAWQKTQVLAVLDRQVLYLGDEAILQVRVIGVGEVGDPVLPEQKGYTLRGGARRDSSRTSIVNGRVDQSVEATYTYAVQPTRPGVLNIAPFEVDVDGTTYRTRPLSLRVTEAPESGFFHIVQEVEKLNPYVREPMTVSLRFFINRNCDTPVFIIPWLVSDDFSVSLPDNSRRSTTQLGIGAPGHNSVSRSFVESKEMYEGTEHQVYTLTFELFPLKPGPIKLGRITSKIEFRSGTETTRGMFGRRVPKTETVFVASNDVDLDVRSLPTEGAPPGFSGSVGTYDLKVHAAPTMVDLGQPIDVSMTFTGKGLLSGLQAPPLSLMPAITDRFKVSGDLIAVSSDGAPERIFTQTLRVKSAEVTEIPPISFHYFDPKAEKYEVVTSKAIPLTVRKTEQAGGTQLEITPSGGGDTTLRNDVKSFALGISELHTSVAALENQSTRKIFSVTALPLWVMPPVLYFAVFFGLSRRRRLQTDEALARRKGARKGALRRLDAAREATDPPTRCDLIAKGVCAFIGDRTNTPVAGLTAQDVAGRLGERGVSDDLVARAEALIEECDLGRYAASQSEEASDLLKRAEDLIRELEKIKL